MLHLQLKSLFLFMGYKISSFISVKLITVLDKEHVASVSVPYRRKHVYMKIIMTISQIKKKKAKTFVVIPDSIALMYFYNKPLYSSTYLQTPAVSVYVKSFYCERHVQEAPLHWAGGVSRIDRTLVMLFIISSFSRFPSTGAARLTGCVTRTLPPAGRSCRLPRTTSAVRQLQTPAVVRLSLFWEMCLFAFTLGTITRLSLPTKNKFYSQWNQSWSFSHEEFVQSEKKRYKSDSDRVTQQSK